jgi:hypothetical protein
MMLDGTTRARRRRGDVLFACIITLGLVCAASTLLALNATRDSRDASREAAAAARRVEGETYARCRNGRAILRAFNARYAQPLRGLLAEAASRTRATARARALPADLRERNLRASRRYIVLRARVHPFNVPTCGVRPVTRRDHG